MEQLPLTPIAPSGRVADKVLDALRDAILSGALAPGARLRIRDAAAALGTSVMPVREAVTKLQSEGLVDSLPYRGAVVRGLTRDEMLDIYAVRRMLESEAAAQGAVAVGIADYMQQLLVDVRAAREGDDLAAFLDADDRFLMALYEAGGNPVLVETIRTLWRRSRSYKLFGLQGEWDSASARLVDYQDDLLRAVRASDGAAAGDVVAASVDRATDRLRAELSSTSAS